MILEVLGAMLTGALVLWLIFSPMISGKREPPLPPEPVADEETRSGIALLALKEIEFDLATGKLSDDDYAMLKERYSVEAITALDLDQLERREVPLPNDPEALVAARRAELRSAASSGLPAPPPCPACGPRPEPDAQYCSSCGRSLRPAFCVSCGSSLSADSRFCAGCGSRVAA